MNKCQKIVGVIAFVVIGICELLMSLNAYLDLKYFIEPYDIQDIIDRMYLRVDSLSVALWLNYFIALALFICLWRKGEAMRLLGKDTCKIFNANTVAENLAVELENYK